MSKHNTDGGQQNPPPAKPVPQKPGLTIPTPDPDLRQYVEKRSQPPAPNKGA